MTEQKYTNFEWNHPRVIATLPKGKDAEKLYNALQNELVNFPIKDWSRLKFNADSHEIYGSNNIEPGVINYLLRDSGVRVAVPRDNINEDISNLINGKHYTDFNANVIYQSKPSYEKNDGLWKKVIELAEEKKGSVKYPFMIQGFYTLPDKEEKEYGIKIVPALNFEIIEDDRFSVKYNGWKFNNVDEKGIPKDLDKSKGKYFFYTRGDGLSGVYLISNGNLVASYCDLAESYNSGRVVLVES